MLVLSLISALSLLVLVGQFVVFLRLARGLSAAEARARADIQETVRAFVTPAHEGEASPLAALADQLSIILAGRVVGHVRQALSGIASGSARNEEAAAVQTMAGSSPLMAILASVMPKKFRAAMLRNPQMVGQLGMFGNNHHEGDEQSSIRNRL